MPVILCAGWVSDKCSRAPRATRHSLWRHRTRAQQCRVSDSLGRSSFFHFPLSFIYFNLKVFFCAGLEKWLGKYLLLLRRTWAQSSTHIMWLTVACNPSSRGSESLFWSLWITALMYVHVCAAPHNIKNKTFETSKTWKWQNNMFLPCNALCTTYVVWNSQVQLSSKCFAL